MKTILFLLLLPVATSVHADPATENIKQACLKQAIALTQKLKSGVLIDMKQSEADQIIRISNEQCQQQFLVSNLQVSPDKAAEKNESASGDWFTDYILSGESSDKEGNRRLDRMRHK